MNAQPCALWQAVEEASLASPEALPDGTLRDHVAGCSYCQQQLGSDSAILQALRASPAPAWSGDGREALRAALAPERVTAARRRRRNQRLLGGGFGAAGLAALVLWLRIATPGAPPATAFRLAASEGAAYATVESGPSTRLRLEDGSLSLQVDHLLPTQSFAIDLPDGRLAVRGTRFTVGVRGGATQEVAVSEGRVEIWLPGEHRMVAAGERWVAEPPEAAPTGPSEPVLPTPDEGSATVAPHPQDRHPAASPARSVAVEPPKPAPAREKARKVAAPTGFPEAVQAFRDRDYAGAEKAFQSFIEAHPSDKRSEDALFLRIRSLQYLGRDTEARTEATRYLDRFPQGLRRPEVEQVIAP